MADSRQPDGTGYALMHHEQPTRLAVVETGSWLRVAGTPPVTGVIPVATYDPASSPVVPYGQPCPQGRFQQVVGVMAQSPAQWMVQRAPAPSVVVGYPTQQHYSQQQWAQTAFHSLPFSLVAPGYPPPPPPVTGVISMETVNTDHGSLYFPMGVVPQAAVSAQPVAAAPVIRPVVSGASAVAAAPMQPAAAILPVSAPTIVPALVIGGWNGPQTQGPVASSVIGGGSGATQQISDTGSSNQTAAQSGGEGERVPSRGPRASVGLSHSGGRNSAVDKRGERSGRTRSPVNDGARGRNSSRRNATPSVAAAADSGTGGGALDLSDVKRGGHVKGSRSKRGGRSGGGNGSGGNGGGDGDVVSSVADDVSEEKVAVGAVKASVSPSSSDTVPMDHQPSTGHQQQRHHQQNEVTQQQHEMKRQQQRRHEPRTERSSSDSVLPGSRGASVPFLRGAEDSSETPAGVSCNSTAERGTLPGGDGTFAVSGSGGANNRVSSPSLSSVVSGLRSRGSVVGSLGARPGVSSAFGGGDTVAAPAVAAVSPTDFGAGDGCDSGGVSGAGRGEEDRFGGGGVDGGLSGGGGGGGGSGNGVWGRCTRASARLSVEGLATRGMSTRAACLLSAGGAEDLVSKPKPATPRGQVGSGGAGGGGGGGGGELVALPGLAVDIVVPSRGRAGRVAAGGRCRNRSCDSAAAAAGGRPAANQVGKAVTRSQGQTVREDAGPSVAIRKNVSSTGARDARDGVVDAGRSEGSTRKTNGKRASSRPSRACKSVPPKKASPDQTATYNVGDEDDPDNDESGDDSDGPEDGETGVGLGNGKRRVSRDSDTLEPVKERGPRGGLWPKSYKGLRGARMRRNEASDAETGGDLEVGERNSASGEHEGDAEEDPDGQSNSETASRKSSSSPSLSSSAAVASEPKRVIATRNWTARMRREAAEAAAAVAAVAEHTAREEEAARRAAEAAIAAAATTAKAMTAAASANIESSVMETGGDGDGGDVNGNRPDPPEGRIGVSEVDAAIAAALAEAQRRGVCAGSPEAAEALAVALSRVGTTSPPESRGCPRSLGEMECVSTQPHPPQCATTITLPTQLPTPGSMHLPYQVGTTQFCNPSHREPQMSGTDSPLTTFAATSSAATASTSTVTATQPPFALQQSNSGIVVRANVADVPVEVRISEEAELDGAVSPDDARVPEIDLYPPEPSDGDAVVPDEIKNMRPYWLDNLDVTEFERLRQWWGD
ncbi:bORF3 [Murid betaherpesvirus 8]|uniref:BORF3 n=1 Tax=Rat cytomegalovirus (isolate England) TaxID=1261657 RepID=A0A0E3SWQ9_RCMVE|nr:bORF3 [Murid betaherpesvirus 8]WPH24936.1 bORF3 [Murid betaherpesvirus 8]WPH25070.1 bORF3 [Murid betaherpesvirus 8]